jgi:peptidyl-prolyl cis-trans isomerase A (cyclophilin A)
MKNMSATFETSLGDFKVQLAPESAPETTRSFIRYATSGIYDGVTFFRVSSKYYLEGGNLADWPPDSPNRKRFFSQWTTAIEQNAAKQVRGTLSMRQIGGPPTGISTSFQRTIPRWREKTFRSAK